METDLNGNMSLAENSSGPDNVYSEHECRTNLKYWHYSMQKRKRNKNLIENILFPCFFSVHTILFRAMLPGIMWDGIFPYEKRR